MNVPLALLVLITFVISLVDASGSTRGLLYNVTLKCIEAYNKPVLYTIPPKYQNSSSNVTSIIFAATYAMDAKTGEIIYSGFPPVPSRSYLNAEVNAVVMMTEDFTKFYVAKATTGERVSSYFNGLPYDVLFHGDTMYVLTVNDTFAYTTATWEVKWTSTLGGIFFQLLGKERNILFTGVGAVSLEGRILYTDVMNPNYSTISLLVETSDSTAVYTWTSETAIIVAINTTTGKRIWTINEPESPNYQWTSLGSPVYDAATDAVYLSATLSGNAYTYNQLIGPRAKDGSTLFNATVSTMGIWSKKQYDWSLLYFNNNRVSFLFTETLPTTNDMTSWFLTYNATTGVVITNTTLDAWRGDADTVNYYLTLHQSKKDKTTAYAFGGFRSIIALNIDSGATLWNYTFPYTKLPGLDGIEAWPLVTDDDVAYAIYSNSSNCGDKAIFVAVSLS